MWGCACWPSPAGRPWRAVADSSAPGRVPAVHPRGVWCDHRDHRTVECVCPATISPSGARLVPVRVLGAADSLVIVLHGGASREAEQQVSPAKLSVLRMIPVARRIARSGRSTSAIFRLLNSRRGWDTHHSPVMDAVWAMDVARERLGDVPVALVGHSLGGRAALLAGDAAPIRAVVALNPWVYPQDDVDLRGRRVLVVHGQDDHVASPGALGPGGEPSRRAGRRPLCRDRRRPSRHAAPWEEVRADGR